MFAKYFSAVPLTTGSANTVARELVKFFFQQSYLPSTLLSVLGTNFTGKLIAELTKLLEVKLKFATLEHPQKIEVGERSHAQLKRILKLDSNEEWNDWHRYVPFATFIHNTSYHSSVNCCPTTLFHGREPVKLLNLRFLHEQSKQLRSIHFRFRSYKTQCFENLAKKTTAFRYLPATKKLL